MRREGSLKIWQEGEKSVWNWGLPLMTWSWLISAHSLDERGVSLRAGLLSWALKRGYIPKGGPGEVRIGRKHASWFGIKPRNLSPALDRLETSGLVILKRKSGSMTRVTPVYRSIYKPDRWRSPVGLWLPPVCHVSRELPPVCLMAYLLMAVRSDRKTLAAEIGPELTGWIWPRKEWSRAIGLLTGTPLVERRGRYEFRLPALLDGPPDLREKLSVGWEDEVFRPQPQPQPETAPEPRPDLAPTH